MNVGLKHIETLCQKLDIQLRFVDRIYGTKHPVWQPSNTLNCDLDDRWCAEGAGVWHEIAHWQIAEPWQLNYPDFALGPHLNTTGPLLDLEQWDSRRVTREQSEHQEQIASETLFYWEPAIGISRWDDLPETYQHLSQTARDFNLEHGLIDSELHRWDGEVCKVVQDIALQPPTRRQWERYRDRLLDISPGKTRPD